MAERVAAFRPTIALAGALIALVAMKLSSPCPGWLAAALDRRILGQVIHLER